LSKWDPDGRRRPYRDSGHNRRSTCQQVDVADERTGLMNHDHMVVVNKSRPFTVVPVHTEGMML
jgi:hypothetical protein